MISPPRAMPQLLSGAGFVSDGAAHGFDDLLEGFLHMLGLQNFVLAPFEVEAQDGNAPLIDNLRIDFAIAVFIGNHFAAAGEMHFAAVEFAQILLHFDAVAAPRIASDSRRAPAPGMPRPPPISM